jgi:hypothetical protein
MGIVRDDIKHLSNTHSWRTQMLYIYNTIFGFDYVVSLASYKAEEGDIVNIYCP